MKDEEKIEQIQEIEDRKMESLIWLREWKDASCEKLIEKHAELEMPLTRYKEGGEAYEVVREIIREHFEGLGELVT